MYQLVCARLRAGNVAYASPVDTPIAQQIALKESFDAVWRRSQNKAWNSLRHSLGPEVIPEETGQDVRAEAYLRCRSAVVYPSLQGKQRFNEVFDTLNEGALVPTKCKEHFS